MAIFKEMPALLGIGKPWDQFVFRFPHWQHHLKVSKFWFFLKQLCLFVGIVMLLFSLELWWSTTYGEFILITGTFVFLVLVTLQGFSANLYSHLVRMEYLELFYASTRTRAYKGPPLMNIEVERGED